MKLLTANAKKFLVLLLALVASFALIACGDKEDPIAKELQEALDSITLGNLNSLNADFDISNTTNKFELEIKWELVDADSTLKLEEKNDDWTTVKVTPTEYTEDNDGNQTNKWGFGKLVATVEKEGKTASRTWELHVVPGAKVEEFTIKQAKNSADKTNVEVSGTVTLVYSNGFTIEDNSGGVVVFLNSAPADNIKAGAEVLVKGEKGTYYGQPQIGTSANKPVVEVTKSAPEGGYDYSKAPKMEIADLNKEEVTNLDHFAKVVKISGMVIKDYISPHNGQKAGTYALKDVVTDEVAVIADSSDKAVKDALEAKVGEFVSVVVVIYEFHSQYKLWRSYGVPGTVTEAEAPELTDEAIIQSVKAEIESALKDKSFATDLELMTESSLGATITWTSQNTAVIANDGKLTTPDEDTEVVLKYKIKINDKEEEFELKVTALAATVISVKEAIDALDAKDTFVVVEGVIIGQDVDEYYYLADETGVIYVRHKLSADDLKVGNKVRVYGKGTVFTGNNNAQFTRQISGDYAVEKLDEKLHDSPLAAVDAQISDFDFTIKSEDVKTKVPQEELYGKVVKFNVYVLAKGDFNNIYLATENNNDAPSILVYYKSMGDDSLRALVGKQATITAVVYDYHVKDGWRLGFLDRAGDIAVELTDEELLALAKTEIEGIVTNDKAVSADLDFIAKSANPFLADVKYVWTTNNTEVIDATGKFTAPDADTDVEVTVKVFLDGNTEGTADKELKYTVKAKAPVEVAGGIIISQVYGGGGNSGAPIKSDFIELYNSSDQDIDVTGWTVFYGSETGNFKAVGSEDYDTGIVLSGTIKAKSFFLIKAADGKNTDLPALPTPDATTSIAMSAKAFKVALCNSSEVPTGPDSANIVDFVGSGNANLFEGTAAPELSNTTAIVRADLTDTNNNGVDFTLAAPNPRNSSYKAN